MQPGTITNVIYNLILGSWLLVLGYVRNRKAIFCLILQFNSNLMEDILLPADFLEQSRGAVIIDVRTPSEFLSGHIPGAVNLSLFTDEERAEVGTLYVKEGKERAVEKGLERVGPKLASFVIKARQLSDGKPLFLYCWRGGMRSASMAWLFRTAGIRTFLLQDGYKAYRHAFQQLLEEYPWNLIVLGGPTGCGKTDILHHLKTTGHQVIDLEGLAHNKGSAFGYLGEAEQPTTEQFGNELHFCMRNFDPGKPVWCEGESISIGKVFIPKEFYAKMLSGLFIQFELSRPFRVKQILKDYGQFTVEELIASFSKLERRLGGEATSRAIKHITQEELEEAIEIALRYYDKGYEKSTLKLWPVINTYVATTNNLKTSTLGLLEFYNTISKEK